MTAEVHIHYHRIPDRTDVYRQLLVLDTPEVKVTYQPSTPLPRPLVVDGRTILEPGSPAVWFTFPGAWHDIGRFHTADGVFTGLYANVLTPCVVHGRQGTGPERGAGADPGRVSESALEAQGVLRWDTTDLFLDVWKGTDGALRLLDAEDLDQAEARGWVDPDRAHRAREEAAALLAAARAGSWPPDVVGEWTLDAARSAVSPRRPPPPRP